MNKVLDFLKSLVVPQKMAKYRYMSALLSIIIFVLTVYLLSVPISYQVDKTFGEMKEQYNFQALLEIESRLPENIENEKVLQDLSNLECAVDNGIMKCAKLSEGEVFDEEIVINVEGITKRIKVKVDLREDATYTVLNQTTNPYVENEEVYVIEFLPMQIFFQAHQKGLNENPDADKISHNGKELIHETREFYTYQTFIPELNLKRDEASARSFGNTIIDIIVASDVKSLQSQFLAYLFINIVILPLLFIVLFWMMFRKTGKLVTFKEYYNIAAISSILPMMITFVLLWVWADYRFSLIYSIFGFLIYYLFVLYKINNSPEVAK